MAWKSNWNQFNSVSGPQQNTGWGLIFRLNKIWDQIEEKIDAADYDGWNFKLDRIFCNILYKKEMEVMVDPDSGTIMEVNLSAEDIHVFEWFNFQIAQIKTRMMKKTGGMHDLRTEFYNLLLKKDIWLRKLIFKLGLYVREVEHDPSRAIYGG